MALADGLRDAEPSEVGALEQLLLRAASTREHDRRQLAAHPDAVEVPMDAIRDQRVRVAIGDGRRLGFSAVLPVHDGVCELDGLFVDPPEMGRGIGRMLMADVAARARGQGATRIEVTAHPGALGFYERMGFVADGTASTRFGPAWRMHLELEPR